MSDITLSQSSDIEPSSDNPEYIPTTSSSNDYFRDSDQAAKLSFELTIRKINLSPKTFLGMSKDAFGIIKHPDILRLNHNTNIFDTNEN